MVSFKIVFEGLKKLVDVKKQTQAINKNVKAVQGSFKKLEDRMADTFNLGPLKKFFSGFGSFIKLGVSSFGKLLKIVGVFGLKMLAFSGIIMILVGFIQIFKKAWDLNLGGVQTTFNRIFGKIKMIYARFQIFLMKTLKQLEPTFKELATAFETLFDALTSPEILNTFTTLIKILVTVLKPVLLIISTLVTSIAAGIDGISTAFSAMDTSNSSGSSGSTSNNINNTYNANFNTGRGLDRDNAYSFSNDLKRNLINRG